MANFLLLKDIVTISKYASTDDICNRSCYKHAFIVSILEKCDCLCGLVVRVLGYRSGGSGSIPGTTRKKNSGSGTGSTQPREYK
jgi:hypothetical protein